MTSIYPLRAATVMAFLAWSAACASAACAHFNARDVDRATEAAHVACIIANAMLPDERSVQVACSLGPEMVDMIRRVVGEHRAGVRRELQRAGVLTGLPAPWPTDGGAP